MRYGFVVACIAAATLAGAASAKNYTCKFSGSDVGKTIAENVYVGHNESTGAVTVQDGFTNNYVGGPVAGTLKSLNATRALFSWRLPSLKDENGNWIPGLTFSLNVIRATGKATISSNPPGNYKSGRASGACAIQ